MYAYVDPRDGRTRYVGRSSSGMVRPRNFKAHYAHCRNWIASLRKEGLEPKIEVLEELPEDASNYEVGMAERAWIAAHRLLGSDLTNLTDGGEGMYGHVPSEETIQKIRKVHLGSKRSEETRRRISDATRAAIKELWKDPEYRRKVALGRERARRGAGL